MKRCLLILLALSTLCLIVGCSSNTQTYTIKDVTKKQTITLHKKHSQGTIASITIIGKGYIDGKAKIELTPAAGSSYETEPLAGNVNFTWNDDWYSDSIDIIYTPSSVKGGNLQLQYHFNDI